MKMYVFMDNNGKIRAYGNKRESELYYFKDISICKKLKVDSIPNDKDRIRSIEHFNYSPIYISEDEYMCVYNTLESTLSSLKFITNKVAFQLLRYAKGTESEIDELQSAMSLIQRAEADMYSKYISTDNIDGDRIFNLAKILTYK